MKDKIVRFLKSKGYYMVLGLCILTVGTVSVLSYRSAQRKLSQTPLENGTKGVEKVKENVPDDRTEAEKTPAKTKEQAQAAAPEYTAPIKGEIIAQFSPTQPLYSYTLKDWRTHSGIDIAAAAGTEIQNVCEGAVESAQKDDLTGNTVVVRHTDGKISRYSSLGEIKVKEGQVLKKGDIIGTVGRSMLLECSETDHLHYELWQDDAPVDPAFLWE
jgi:murein DD-endopeptidase MepM/ murein hydrolase activator NlpD